MQVDGVPYRTIWPSGDGRSVDIIDQTLLPHEFRIVRLETLEDAARAIKTMQVRGAPLIGAAAAYGVCLALRADASDEALDRVIAFLAAQRPTAVNLRWALDEMRHAVRNVPRDRRVAAAYARAAEICEEDVAANRRIGEHGLKAILAAAEHKS
ncbi:MAG: S-methyl-5-thioribose-1-phosphate isomerase, partial [Dongiaceae bacterium]